MKTQTLVERHAKDIQGVIECFDRVVLFGTYKAIGWTGAMEQHLRRRGTSFMEFNQSYANQLRLEVADNVRALSLPVLPSKHDPKKIGIGFARDEVTRL